MKQEELRTILDNHKLWLEVRSKGKKANLCYSDLSNTDLRYTNLRGANLNGADLHGADLSNADLSSSNLNNADLFGVNLSGVNLGGANLHGANLSGANLSDTDLTGADLREADLREADLDFASFPLWCGGLNIKIDRKLAIQFLFHALNQECDDKDFLKIRNNTEIIEFLKEFHRIKEKEAKPYWEKEELWE